MLRANSSTDVGRDNRYKSDPECIHIGDLKVPKKYITITIAGSSLDDLRPTELSIRFDSICTTDVNGTVYKLPSRDAASVTHTFLEKELLLKVNANKSDRIKLQLTWVDVTVMAFSKKILFQGEIQHSPLPEALLALHSKGIDIRTTTDPFGATHYLTLSEHVDYPFQIAVLRGIPVVTSKWLEYLESSPDNVDRWLFNVDGALLLQDTKHDYVYPNSKRPELFAGCSVVLCTEDDALKQTTRLAKWLSIFQVNVLLLNSSQKIGTPTLVSEIETRFGNENNLIPFNSCANDLRCRELFGAHFNSADDLWRAVVAIDASKLRRFAVDKLPRTTVKEEPESLRLTQRRKRRKVERVSDTDFFLFTPVSSSIPKPDDSLNPRDEDAIVEAESSAKSATKSPSITEAEPISEILTEPPAEVPEVPTETNIAAKDHDQAERREDIEEETKAQEPPQKKAKRQWIVPQVSLAEAILSTKQKAEEIVKLETTNLSTQDLQQDLDKLVIVEEIDLKVQRKPHTDSMEVNPDFRGRKNFKAFRKNGPKPYNLTRTYLELQDDTNEIQFADLQGMHPPEEFAGKVRKDFENEMGSVKGYQPDMSQLFVAEDESSDNDEIGFQFLQKAGPSVSKRNSYKERASVAPPLHEDDDDDDFAFAFSKR